MPEMNVDAALNARSPVPTAPCRRGFGLLTPDFVKLSPAFSALPTLDTDADGAIEDAFDGATEAVLVVATDAGLIEVAEGWTFERLLFATILPVTVRSTDQLLPSQRSFVLCS